MGYFFHSYQNLHNRMGQIYTQFRMNVDYSYGHNGQQTNGWNFMRFDRDL